MKTLALVWVFTVRKKNPQNNEKEYFIALHVNNGWYIYEDTKRKKSTLFLTSPQVLLLGFAAHAIDPQNRLHVALVDRWRVQYGFGGPGQAHGQTCSAHQDTCHT